MAAASSTSVPRSRRISNASSKRCLAALRRLEGHHRGPEKGFGVDIVQVELIPISIVLRLSL